MTLLIPSYALKALTRFKHPHLDNLVHSPEKFNQPIYSTKMKHATQPGMGKKSQPNRLIFIQQAVGAFFKNKNYAYHCA